MGEAMQLNEKIYLEKYNPDWILQFEKEKLKLQNKLDLYDLCCIEHIGSTAIPNITAKPIVDILIGIEMYPPNEDMIKSMADMGYINWNEAGVEGRVYLSKRSPDSFFNCHIVQYESDIWNNNILLRDYLKKHEDEAKAYSELKQRIVKQGADDLLEYSNKKSEFIFNLLEEARQNNFSE